MLAEIVLWPSLVVAATVCGPDLVGGLVRGELELACSLRLVDVVLDPLSDYLLVVEFAAEIFGGAMQGSQ